MTRTSPGEGVRNYYRLQGATRQLDFDLKAIANFHLQNHQSDPENLVSDCDCIKLVQTIQEAVKLEFAAI